MLQIVVQTRNRNPGGFCWSNTSAFGPKVCTSVHATLDFKFFVLICSFCVCARNVYEDQNEQNEWEDNCFG